MRLQAVQEKMTILQGKYNELKRAMSEAHALNRQLMDRQSVATETATAVETAHAVVQVTTLASALIGRLIDHRVDRPGAVLDLLLRNSREEVDALLAFPGSLDRAVARALRELDGVDEKPIAAELRCAPAGAGVGDPGDIPYLVVNGEQCDAARVGGIMEMLTDITGRNQRLEADVKAWQDWWEELKHDY